MIRSGRDAGHFAFDAGFIAYFYMNTFEHGALRYFAPMLFMKISMPKRRLGMGGYGISSHT